MDIERIIKKHKRIMLDTAPIIYFIEEQRDLGKIANQIITISIRNNINMITSVITLIEVLTHPLQLKRHAIVEKYKEILCDSRDLIMYPIDEIIAERAAELRAKYALKTPDALQIATCIEYDASLFVTNDVRLKKIDEVAVLLLSDVM